MTNSTPHTGAFGPCDVFVPGSAAKSEIGHYLDCTANPFDLRPAADIIIGAATAMLKTLPEDKPLVILMGECHTMPTCKELQHLVALRLHKMNLAPSVCFEEPYNFWTRAAQQAMDIDVPEDLAHDPAADHSGRASLSAVIGYFGHNPAAPVANIDMIAFCYEHDITAAFNDAVRYSTISGDVVLDINDPATADFIGRYTEQSSLPRIYNAEEPEGMAIRNLFMAEHGLAAARRHETHLILQTTGLAHIFGHALTDQQSDYEDSLCAAYQNAGAAVLPVFITTPRLGPCGLNMIPHAARPTLQSSVVIDGLAQQTFFLSQNFAKFYGDNDYIHEEGAEQKFIEYLHEESGGEMTFHDVEKQKSRYQKLARNDVQEVIKRPVNHCQKPC